MDSNALYEQNDIHFKFPWVVQICFHLLSRDKFVHGCHTKYVDMFDMDEDRGK